MREVVFFKISIFWFPIYKRARAPKRCKRHGNTVNPQMNYLK